MCRGCCVCVPDRRSRVRRVARAPGTHARQWRRDATRSAALRARARRDAQPRPGARDGRARARRRAPRHEGGHGDRARGARSRSSRGRRSSRAAATSSRRRSRPSRSTSSGLACLDVGASTGGFTDCLLQAGAAHVTALDVGRGQLHERLRADDRVTLLEGVNARLLAPGDLPGPPARSRSSTSRSSRSRSCCRRSSACLAHPYRVLPLVKPQFEAGRGEVRRGVVRDPGRPRGGARARRGVAARGRAASCSAPARAAIPAPRATASSSCTSSRATTRRPRSAPADPLPLLRDAVA